MENLFTEVKVLPAGLGVGMFVSRLDIPWINTPFLLEGLYLKTQEEIAYLRNSCQFVFVDTSLGLTPEPRFILEHVPDKKSVYSHQMLIDKADQSGQEEPEDSIRSATRHEESTKEPKKSRQVVQSRNPKSGALNPFGVISLKKPLPLKTDFYSELGPAEAIHEKLKHDLDQIMVRLKDHNPVDLSIIEKSVRDMVESIIRNPSAMIWVAQINRLYICTYSRALSTSVWCAAFGRYLGLTRAALETLAMGGLLLDIGKSKLPPEFLYKTEPLTPVEHKIMTRHVEFSNNILDETRWGGLGIRAINDIRAMVAEHHERADGSGYPNGLQHEDISLFGHMAGMVDSFDAMTCNRAYAHKKGCLSPHAAVNELYAFKETLFQRELVEKFILCVGIYPAGSLVELNTGEVAAVVSINPDKRLRPNIIILLDKNKEPLSTAKELNLDKVDKSISIVHGLASGAHDVDLTELSI